MRINNVHVRNRAVQGYDFQVLDIDERTGVSQGYILYGTLYAGHLMEGLREIIKEARIPFDRELMIFFQQSLDEFEDTRHEELPVIQVVRRRMSDRLDVYELPTVRPRDKLVYEKCTERTMNDIFLDLCEEKGLIR